MFGKSFTSRYITHALTTVSYHNPNTGFLDEIKITLPVQATSRHHLLFTFYHITVDSQKKEKTESVVGYSWLPIIQENGRCEGSFELPVASANTSGDYILPANYMQATRSKADMEKAAIKWLDGGKPLFAVKTVCKSSVYTNDDHLRKFFRAIESDDLSELSSNALRERIKALHAVLPDELFRYHPVIFNQLFDLLTRKTSASTDSFEEVPDHILKFLIYAVDFICTTMKDDPNGANRLMNSYLTHVFKAPVTSPNQPTVHEQLVKYMVESSNHTDITVKEKLLKNIWWFLGIVSKSMAQHVAAFKLFAVKRDERFSPVCKYNNWRLFQLTLRVSQTFVNNLTSFIDFIVQEIISRSRTDYSLITSINTSLAAFLKRCLSLMDRGIVFSYIEKIVVAMSQQQTIEFLVCWSRIQVLLIYLTGYCRFTANFSFWSQSVCLSIILHSTCPGN